MKKKKTASGQYPETVQYRIKNPDGLIHQKQYSIIVELCVLAEQASARARQASSVEEALRHSTIGHACLARSIELLHD